MRGEHRAHHGGTAESAKANQRVWRVLAFRHACDILFHKTTGAPLRKRSEVAKQEGAAARKKAVRKERFAMAVWNPKIECAKRSEIEAIQLERLKWSVQHAYDHVPMYHDKMVKAA